MLTRPASRDRALACRTERASAAYVYLSGSRAPEQLRRRDGGLVEGTAAQRGAGGGLTHGRVDGELMEGRHEDVKFRTGACSGVSGRHARRLGGAEERTASDARSRGAAARPAHECAGCSVGVRLPSGHRTRAHREVLAFVVECPVRYVAALDRSRLCVVCSARRADRNRNARVSRDNAYEGTTARGHLAPTHVALSAVSRSVPSALPATQLGPLVGRPMRAHAVVRSVKGLKPHGSRSGGDGTPPAGVEVRRPSLAQPRHAPHAPPRAPPHARACL
jgi:hypothetical protein